MLELWEDMQEEGALDCNHGKQSNLTSHSAQINLLLVYPLVYMLELHYQRPPSVTLALMYVSYLEGAEGKTKLFLLSIFEEVFIGL